MWQSSKICCRGFLGMKRLVLLLLFTQDGSESHVPSGSGASSPEGCVITNTEANFLWQGRSVQWRVKG